LKELRKMEFTRTIHLGNCKLIASSAISYEQFKDEYGAVDFDGFGKTFY
jgi:hypothetical protein